MEGASENGMMSVKGDPGGKLRRVAWRGGGGGGGLEGRLGRSGLEGKLGRIQRD